MRFRIKLNSVSFFGKKIEINLMNAFRGHKTKFFEHFLVVLRNIALMNILLTILTVAYNVLKIFVKYSLFSKIGLEMAEIFMLKAIKIQLFCYFTYIFTPFYIKV